MRAMNDIKAIINEGDVGMISNPKTESRSRSTVHFDIVVFRSGVRRKLSGPGESEHDVELFQAPFLEWRPEARCRNPYVANQSSKFNGVFHPLCDEHGR